MKKPTSWDLYFQKQLGDPEMRGLIDAELESLHVGTQIAQWRQTKGLSQSQLAARAGMSVRLSERDLCVLAKCAVSKWLTTSQLQLGFILKLSLAWPMSSLRR